MWFVAKRLNPESEILAMYHFPLRTVYLAIPLPSLEPNSCINALF
jgi:hypothetical protein